MEVEVKEGREGRGRKGKGQRAAGCAGRDAWMPVQQVVLGKGGRGEGSGDGKKHGRGEQARPVIAALHAPLMCFLPAIDR